MILQNNNHWGYLCFWCLYKYVCQVCWCTSIKNRYYI